MYDRFTVDIVLGNEAMSDPEHVAEALERVASELRERAGTELKPVHSRTIRDLNGNTVGSWNVSRSEKPWDE